MIGIRLTLTTSVRNAYYMGRQATCLVGEMHVGLGRFQVQVQVYISKKSLTWPAAGLDRPVTDPYMLAHVRGSGHESMVWSLLAE